MAESSSASNTGCGNNPMLNFFDELRTISRRIERDYKTIHTRAITEGILKTSTSVGRKRNLEDVGRGEEDGGVTRGLLVLNNFHKDIISTKNLMDSEMKRAKLKLNEIQDFVETGQTVRDAMVNRLDKLEDYLCQYGYTPHQIASDPVVSDEATQSDNKENFGPGHMQEGEDSSADPGNSLGHSENTDDRVEMRSTKETTAAVEHPTHMVQLNMKTPELPQLSKFSRRQESHVTEDIGRTDQLRHYTVNLGSNPLELSTPPNPFDDDIVGGTPGLARKDAPTETSGKQGSDEEEKHNETMEEPKVPALLSHAENRSLDTTSSQRPVTSTATPEEPKTTYIAKMMNYR